MTNNIYDKSGKLIGRILKDEKTGTETAYAKDGKLLGRSLVVGNGATKSTVQHGSDGAVKSRGADASIFFDE
jgi:hypothetical protein